MILKYIYSFLLLILLVTYYSISVYSDIFLMVCLLSTVAFSILLFLFKKEPIAELKGQNLKHSTIALLAIVIVHFQYPIDFVLDRVGTENLQIWQRPEIVAKSLFLSTIGFLSLLFGYTAMIKKRSKQNLKYVFRSRINLSNVRSWIAEKERKASLIIQNTTNTTPLLVLSTGLLIGYFSTVNPKYLAGYYGYVSVGATATYIILLFKVVVFSILIQNDRNARIKERIPSSFIEYLKQQNLFLILLVCIYLASVMISGDRGPIITFSIAFLSGYYFVTKRKLKFKSAIVLVLVGAFIISILGIARSLDKRLSFSEKIDNSIQFFSQSNGSIMPLTSELSGCIKAFLAVVDFVPEKHPHTFGRFQFQQILFAIPFTGAIPAYIFSDFSYRYKGPASFVTWVIQGDKPTYGDGTTCITDMYVEFGVVGIISGMFFLGYLLRYLEIQLFSKRLPSLFPHIFSFVYLSDAIYISRSSILFGFRSVVWIYIAMYLNAKLFSQAKIK